ncbi:MAG: hypothetical protein WAL32_13395 [Terriglobales bacterium]
MSKFTRLLASLAIIGLAGTLIAVSAAPSQQPRITPMSEQPAAALTASYIFNRQLLSTTQSYGLANIVSGGDAYVAIDAPLKFTCPSGTTCTVSVDQNTQMGGNSASLNGFSICTALDGTFMSQPSCPTLASLPTDGSYFSGSFVQSASNLKSGPHTIQTFVFTNARATVYTYNFTYRLYKP